MIQRISNGKSTGYTSHYTRAGYYRTKRLYRTCHLCRKAITAGEEWVGFADDNGKSMHRPCLLDWLAKHPTPEKAVIKRLSDEEADKEFAKIRRKIMRQTRSQTPS